MSVTNADLVVVASANMPEDDVSLSGGVVDLAVKMTFTDIDVADTVNIVSDNANDDIVLRVFGKDASGADVTEDLTLSSGTATTPDAGAQTFLTIDKVVKQSGTRAAGATVTLYRTSAGDPLATFEAASVSPTDTEITTVRKIFYDATSGAAQKLLYEKVFYHNNNATFTLSDANIQIEAFTPPGSLTFAVGLSATLDDSASVAQRLDTAPGGVSFVAPGVDVAVANSQNHSPGSDQGVWIRITIPLSHAAVQSSTFTLVEAGGTL